MKILNFALSRLHHDEHFQFHTSLKNLILTFSLLVMKLGDLFTNFQQLLDNEGIALDKVLKSAITKQMEIADDLRDETFRGFCDAVKSGLKHFRADVRQAAQRLQVLLDRYGNLAVKPDDGETGSLIALINDLTTTYAADVAMVGLNEWVAELNANNLAFDNLKNSRYTEETKRTQLIMKQERVKVDAVYHQIVDLINAYALVEGEAPYADFINELNRRIKSHSNTLAIRQGLGAKDADAPAATK